MADRDAKGTCKAPGCGVETPHDYDPLCSSCVQRVEAAMREARPRLLAAMVTEREEAERWLAADWAPPRRWVLANEGYEARPLDDVVSSIATELGGCLGFVDDAHWQRWEDTRRRHDPTWPPRRLLAWRVSDASSAGAAWRDHLAPIIRSALEQALATFPLSWAGVEIKEALTGEGEYADAVDTAIEEIEDGSGPSGLSDGGLSYLSLRYPPFEHWKCEAGDWPDEPGAELWLQYRVLPNDIMAILDALPKPDGWEGDEA